MSLAVLALLTSPSDACGGMFCNNAQPTMQAAERIAFAIDEAAGEVEAHVQITYTGESKDFAWIVPVSGEPELFLSTDDLFAALYFPTNPTYSTTVRVDGECKSENRGGLFSSESALSDAGSDTDADFTMTNTVNVVSQKAVGPYETVTLEAGTSEGLLAWLQDNGYDLPANLGPALDPYVADGMSFVALRLAADATTGDIAPLGMRYAGTKASVPIQLTSIAAVPDTRLEVYVFAKARVVPESYLHVIPNDMAYDWFQQTVVYDDIVTLAANEAGGHAFATDFSAETANLRGLVWDAANLDMDRLRTQLPAAWMASVLQAAQQTAGNGGYYYYSSALSDPNLTAVLRQVLPLPAHLVNQTSEINWWSCLDCYPAELAALDWDADVATTALSVGWVEPLERAEGMVAGYPHISRLTSSLDALEMTVDPVFVVNEDMAQSVGATHTATLVYDCESRSTTFGEADRELIFPDGSAVKLPSEQWFADNGTTEYAYLQDLAAINAAVIEQTGANGEAVVVSDQRGALADILARLNTSFADEFGKGGCGCDGGAGAPVMPLGVLAATLLLRRRKRA